MSFTTRQTDRLGATHNSCRFPEHILLLYDRLFKEFYFFFHSSLVRSFVHEPAKAKSAQVVCAVSGSGRPCLPIVLTDCTDQPYRPVTVAGYLIGLHLSIRRASMHGPCTNSWPFCHLSLIIYLIVSAGPVIYNSLLVLHRGVCDSQIVHIVWSAQWERWTQVDCLLTNWLPAHRRPFALPPRPAGHRNSSALPLRFHCCTFVLLPH